MHFLVAKNTHGECFINSKFVIEWLMERYCVTTGKK